MGRKLSKIFVGLFALATFLTLANKVIIEAETLPTFEYTEETKDKKPFVATVITEELNVRLGPGIEHPWVYLLKEGDKVAVFDSAEAATGNIWYFVRFVADGREYSGYVAKAYTQPTGEDAVNIPTPTPVITSTPSPTPEIKETPTVAPTQEVKQDVPKKAEKKGVNIILVVLGIFILLIVGFYLYYRFIILKKKTELPKSEMEKLEKLKKATERAEIINREKKLYSEKPEQISNVSFLKTTDTEKTENGANSSDDENDTNRNLLNSVKEKEEIKKELDELQDRDLVYHKYFGEGTVVNNDDVNNVEVRFGNEVRFINKESAAAKRIMRKL